MLTRGSNNNVAQTEKLSRKQLKNMVEHDAFRDGAAGTIEYVAEHKSQVYKWVAAGLAVAAVAVGFFFYRGYQQTQRQNGLYEALRTYGAVVSETAPPFADKVFKNAQERNEAVRKDFTALAEKYPGSDEGTVARYYLGVFFADNGNAAESEKNFKIAADSSGSYVPLAKVSLAQLYRSQGKMAEAESLGRGLVANPGPFFSKEHATIELARIIADSKPDEARKLLEPLRTARPAISQAALTALSDMAQKK